MPELIRDAAGAWHDNGKGKGEPMLPLQLTAETIPAPAHVAAFLGEYAAALRSALCETPRHYAGPTYLPTCRAIRAAEDAAADLEGAAQALAMAGAFVAPVASAGGYARPVDLLASALRRLAAARQALEAHQSAAATPLENRAGCWFLAEWMPLAAADLEEVLAPVCDLLGRVEP